MFRHERPQKGRYRQFYQFGIEAFGMAGPDIDVEVIQFSRRLWQRLGLLDKLELQINSLGTAASRKAYREVLVNYFKANYHELDEDSQRRLDTNPLRILDSKNPALQTVIQQAPKLQDHLDEESKNHFNKLCELLDANGIKYVINPNLVRGLDYYCFTVFEWVYQ
jgi:histidyl-tRNA synthetase